MRSEGAEGSSSTSDCDDPLVVIACAAETDACPAACREDAKEDESDEIVKSGDLAVTAKAASLKKAINDATSDLDTLMFKTSEEVEITRVTLERYGYSKAADVAGVRLEDEDGNVIAKSKPISATKDTVTLSIDKDYRKVDGSMNATIVVKLNNTTSSTIGFKVVDVESTAKNLNVDDYSPTEYEIVSYAAVKVNFDIKGSNKDYNYEEGEFYEVAKFKLNASTSALSVKGFTLTNKTPNTKLNLEDFLDDVRVTVDGEEVKGLKYSFDKSNKLTVSFDEVEIAARGKAIFAVEIALANLDVYTQETQFGIVSSSDLIATEKKTGARVDVEGYYGCYVNAAAAIADGATFDGTTAVRVTTAGGSECDSTTNAPAVAPAVNDGNYYYLGWATHRFLGGKVKYTSSKLNKVEVEAGATDVVVAEGTIEIPEPVNAAFTVTVPTAGVVEEMRMYVAGEEFEGTPNGSNFDFEVELTKGGKVQFKVDVNDDATKGTKVSINSVNFGTMGANLAYDSNDSAAIAAGSVVFAELSVVKAKASLENNLDKAVEFVKDDTANRKVVFDGTYTAKKADVYLDTATFAGDSLAANPTTFYLILNGDEVASFDKTAANVNDDFTRVLVKAGESIPVKVEAEVTTNTVAGPYAITLQLDGKDVDDVAVNGTPVPLADFSVVGKGSITVTAATSKTTVLLKKANTPMAQFTVKPEKSGDDVDLEDIVLDAGTLTADKLTVKIDGTAVEGEDVAVYSTTAAYNVGDLVVYGTSIWKNTTAIAAPGEAWTAGHWTDLRLNVTNNTASIFYDLTEDVDSDGVTVEIILKNKTDATGSKTIKVTDINGKNPSKTFTKRFEDALVWVASQRDNAGSTTFVLGVEKSDSSIEINNVCLYYIDSATSVASKCALGSVSDGNDDIEWTNPDAGGKQIMIDAIIYNTVNNTVCADPTVAGSKITAASATAGCVTITKEDYNDYFKVGDTYAKIFKVD